MLLILLFACLPTDLKEATGPTCVDSATDVALDEVTPLGFAAQDVLPFASGLHATAFTYADGTVTGASLEVTPGATARFVDSEADYGEDTGAQPAIAIECPDRVEIDATEAFTTEDGALAESWTFPLSATSVEGIGFSGEMSAFTGSLVLEDYAALEGNADYDEIGAFVDGSFDAAGANGTLYAQTSGTDDCEDSEDCTAWASQQAIGAWAPVPE